MPQNKNVQTLIDKAAKTVGGRGKLAKRLAIPIQHISNWSDGSRTCVPADRARLAGIANECAVQELIRSTIERSAGTVRGSQLMVYLGKVLPDVGQCVTVRCFRA